VNPVKIVAIVLLVSMMFHAGLQVNREHLQAVLKNYGLLGRAFLGNFILVPIYGVLIVRGFHLSAAAATGILLMAICPGVPFIVLSGGRKKGGSLGLAVSLEFLLQALSIITVPITASFVLPGSNVESKSIIASVFIFQLVPLLMGMYVNARAPETGERLRRPLGVVVVIVLVLILALLAPKLVWSIESVYGSFRILAILAVVLLSLVTGWLLGGTRREYRRTLAFGTTLRNIALAAVIATTAFGGGDVTAAVFTYFFVQVVVVGLIGVVFTRMTKHSQVPA
jgi:BASS family bile acid:Na+ symporter